MSAAETFAPILADVATEIYGKPHQESGNGSSLRWGTHGSLAVDTEKGTWFDHEAKEGGGTIDLVMRAHSCDKTTARTWLERKGFIPPLEKEAGTFYNYCDEDGSVLFRVERCGSGSRTRFLQHGPDGKGGFVCRSGCMNGVRRVPYRLPRLLAREDETVYVCEGEKDANRLIKIGLLATTNPGGAGKWLSEFSQYLAGRRVIVLEDNDQAGRDHAADVKAKLQGVAAAVEILALPGLGEKEDVSDWLDAGGTVEELQALAERAVASPRSSEIPEASGPAYLRGISAADLMAKHFEPVNYVIPDLLAEGAFILAGPPKLGKSWLCYDFGLAIAAGRPIFGSIPITQGDVLYLALEDSERRLKSRLLKKGIREAPRRLTLATEWPGLDDGCIAELEAWADAVKRPTLVIVDVLKMVRGATRSNETVYDADYRALTGLANFARTRGLAVLVVHHTRKMAADDPLESISGTNGLTGCADGVMVLKRDIGTGHCLLYVRGRDIEENETALQFDRDIGTWQRLGAADEVGRTTEREAIMAVLRSSDKPLNAREISDISGKNYDATRKTLARMAHAGEAEKSGRGLYTCPNRPNVPDTSLPPSDCDIGTHGTGYESGDWIGERPAETAARIGRAIHD